MPFLSPTTTQRCHLETDKFILEDVFSSVLSHFKKYSPSVNVKFNNYGSFKSLKLRNLMGKILQISLHPLPPRAMPFGHKKIF